MKLPQTDEGVKLPYEIGPLMSNENRKDLMRRLVVVGDQQVRAIGVVGDDVVDQEPYFPSGIRIYGVCSYIFQLAMQKDERTIHFGANVHIIPYDSVSVLPVLYVGNPTVMFVRDMGDSVQSAGKPPFRDVVLEQYITAVGGPSKIELPKIELAR